LICVYGYTHTPTHVYTHTRTRLHGLRHLCVGYVVTLVDLRYVHGLRLHLRTHRLLPHAFPVVGLRTHYTAFVWFCRIRFTLHRLTVTLRSRYARYVTHTLRTHAFTRLPRFTVTFYTFALVGYGLVTWLLRLFYGSRYRSGLVTRCTTTFYILRYGSTFLYTPAVCYD